MFFKEYLEVVTPAPHRAIACHVNSFLLNKLNMAYQNEIARAALIRMDIHAVSDYNEIQLDCEDVTDTAVFMLKSTDNNSLMVSRSPNMLGYRQPNTAEYIVSLMLNNSVRRAAVLTTTRIDGKGHSLLTLISLGDNI